MCVCACAATKFNIIVYRSFVFVHPFRMLLADNHMTPRITRELIALYSWQEYGK